MPYRLKGDLNPLHADPLITEKAVFKAPIAHGPATYGLACYALIDACGDNNRERLSRFDVRFAAPVYPGESIVFDIWKGQKQSQFLFEAHVKEHKAKALGSGVAEFDL